MTKKEGVKFVSDWANMYRVRINNFSDAFSKHEIIKLLIMKSIIQKYHSKKMYHEVYSEYPMNGKIADVLHINRLTGEGIAYEIQSKVDEKYIKETGDAYSRLNMDWVLVKVDTLSDDIHELNKQIKEIII